MNFVTEVVDAADRHRTALVAVSAGGARQEVEFGELSERAGRLAGAFRAQGVGRGDVVMTLIGNRPEWVTALLACFRIGAVALPCTLQLRPADLRQRMDAVEPALVIAVGDGADAARSAGFSRADPRGGRRTPVRPRRGARRGPGGHGPGADRVHLRHVGRAEAGAPRPALPVGAIGPGRALVRRQARRADLVHGGQRLVQVGAQLLHRTLAAGSRRAPARRALRPRGAAGVDRARGRGRAVHGAHRVPRDRQARRPAAAPGASARGGGGRGAEPRGGPRLAGRRRRGRPRRLRADRDRGADRHAARGAPAPRLDGRAAARLPPLGGRRRALRRPRHGAHLLHRRAAGHLAHRATACARTRTATCGSRGAPTT